MFKSLVSIMISLFNQGIYLKDALDSLKDYDATSDILSALLILFYIIPSSFQPIDQMRLQASSLKKK